MRLSEKSALTQIGLNNSPQIGAFFARHSGGLILLAHLDVDCGLNFRKILQQRFDFCEFFLDCLQIIHLSASHRVWDGYSINP